MNATDYFTDPSLSCLVVQTTTAEHQAPSANTFTLERDLFRQSLLQAVVDNPNKPAMLAAVAEVLDEQLEAKAFVYFDRDQSQALFPAALRGSQVAESNDEVMKALLGLADASCRQGRLVTGPLPGNPQLVAACLPVDVLESPAQALLVLFAGVEDARDVRLDALAVVAAYISLWHVQRGALVAEREAQLTAAMQELLEEVENCENLSQACGVLVDRMREYVDCDRVALATCPRWGSRSRLQAVSGVERFDNHSTLVTAVESALDESIVREEMTVWPPESSAGRQAALAHHKLCSVADVSCVVSSPLRNGQGELIGAWVFMGAKESLRQPHISGFLQAAETRVASCLSLMSRVRRSLLARLLSTLVGKHGSWKSRSLLLGLCLAMAALLLPVTYRIHCDCQLEPVTRRYMAAPYDGILEKALVTAGATVKPGDVLAKMDGREIRWELAGVTAERDRAAKQAEASFANHDFAAANVARLEVDRLDLKKQLFESRQKNLEITCPIEGMVIFGDLEKAEGAPVTCGQTLFEIAPLAQMVAELAVPETDVPYLHEGQKVVLHLEACPQGPLRATITRIHPRSQIREQQNIFLAEVTLENNDGYLRPGMQGSARIEGPRCTLAWSLFHKPWQSLCRWLGW